ncbi:HORMA domain containing protein [Phenylobacterium soli]|uniref:HORMA domain containing protein n=1 Tax=Phenylobacterium soli TaxID=2170551 RepID=A0A328AN90_9CAUL|nr:HORMA domain containing protein [Phenylobacterium soli]RAK54904.1 HORMA domain containing protein [Phenylobacterium soli]
MSVSTFTYTRTHTATYVADNMRNQLKRIIQAAGLSPEDLADSWNVLGEAVRTWLRSGHLRKVILEFYKPGSDKLEGRWDFDIDYDGSGVDDDMWVDREHLRRTIEKAGQPPPGCVYRVVLRHDPEAPMVTGMSSTDLRATDGFTSRAAGTSIATSDIMAGLNYWRRS